MTAIQAVYVLGYEDRPTPKPHTVYHIQIKAQIRSWSMWRRYSEFDELNDELTKSTGHPPPHPLPPKHKFSILRSHNDPALLEERKQGLELYLRAIISSKEDTWREHRAFKDFLGIPVGRHANVPDSSSAGQFTSATWLDEYQSLLTRLREVRSDINKREALSSQDITASQKSSVAAKQKLAGVLSRIGNLGMSLKELAANGMNEGELQRRTDMVARLQDDCEKLGKMVAVTRQSARDPIATSTTGSATDANREALLGSGHAFQRITRVFGSSEPQETEVTRPLDDRGLVGLQQQQIEQQDEQLSVLTTILQRQRQLGEAINREITSQIEMLDDLSNEVDRVGGNLSSAQKQMNKLRS
jgi:regulator of vacuolar morphogenesis